ncbi:MAG TPA: KR domain-containing protein, partial [Candidatus Angelobacter sp.]|nr:KR domain-containing protein [Candidatus Angelobacter sp.]
SDETGKGEAAIDWVGEIEKHRGERLLFFYQRDQDLEAITELIRKFEGTLDTPEVFRCSYIKLLEHVSSLPTGLPSGVNAIALDDHEQQRRFLQSLEDAQSFPDAFFFLPGQATVAEKESAAEAFFRSVVQKLLLHASGNSIAGYYCYEATGDRSEFQGEALAAEVNSLKFGSANHFYRWIRVPTDITELQKAAMLLRERLAYAPGSRGTELVDYSGGKRTVRILELIKNPEPTAGGSILGSGDTCLITGSLGEVGLALCGELSRRYQANMIVAPSAPLSQKETDQLATLRNAGAKIHYLPNPGEDSQSLQKTLARAAGSITQIRGIIDLGPSEEAARRHGDTLDSSNASMGVVEKAWKPKPLVNSNTAKMNGKCVILVNANSVALAEGQFRQAVEGQTLMVGGEDINSANVKIVNWADISSGRKAAQKVLSELGDVDYVLDLSDLYSESRSSDACQYGRIGFLQELIGRYRDLTILYFTRGLQAFQSQWATLAGSRRAGFMKMLSAEYGHVKAKCIDVDSEFLASSLLPLRVISEAMTTLEETEICYRHGKRFVPYLEARKLGGGSDSQHSGLPVRPKGSYVISGGTNGIGLEIASHLAGLGAKNLALLGITPLPPKGQWRSALESNEISAYVRRKLEKLLEIQSLGVNLEIYSGRLVEREKLAGFLSAFRSKAGRINGVVHSAGCAPDISDGKFAFVNKSQEDLQRVFEPKADGLETLHEALAGDSPDFFVTFSSIAAMIPSFAKGISDYAAANAFADHFVSYQIGQRREYFCSMAWVGWSDVGLHRSDAALPSDGLPERRAASVGLLFNSSRQGIELFEAALSDAGSRSHRLPCLLNESAFQRSSDTLLWARPAILNTMQEAAALDLHSGNADLGYVLSIDEITQQAPLNFFVLLSQLSTEGAAGRRQAYRNGFCSAFAAHRNELVTRGKRKGATLALQAGPWKSGSSAVSDNSLLERLVPQAALSLIEAALAQGGSSILVSDSRNKDLAYSVAGATLKDELVPSTSKQNSASESPFEQVLTRLKNADRNAREQILLEVNLDRFSDDQIEELYGLVFENNIRPEMEEAQVTSKTANQSSEQSISRQEIKTVIAAELKDVLRLNGTTVSERDRFQQYGLDSISGMQLVSRLERVLGLEVPPRWLIDYCTIETLSEKINDTQQLDMAASAK